LPSTRSGSRRLGPIIVAASLAEATHGGDGRRQVVEWDQRGRYDVVAAGGDQSRSELDPVGVLASAYASRDEIPRPPAEPHPSHPERDSEPMSTTPSELQSDLEKLQSLSGPYPAAAFQFLRDGLEFTVQRVHADGSEPDRHVSGRQLCFGLRDFAIRQYGLLAIDVLESWNLHRTDDFGRMVFALIELGVLAKSDDDTLDDFRGVFDFEEAFTDAAVRSELSAV